ncbi:nucleotidyltransferase family protein [Flavobacterium subsaxonicum]|uniref:DNA polymerase subunit beta n=1 Tax=Flavobacterium subsaxonicum WB 4.1-42 = DSM 21790 TaxID=1121898 RepID=A0A0A2N2W8_9FLAO|nr:nucleotidyltransferase domain-containing protein [Flavobacterium subsaxonicum]KGO94805.1 DNA polymerase subunit beta [Flavobacterium subsaxonicum WB 4.1-42 = DSM 21790]
MALPIEIESNRYKLTELCEKYKVIRLFVFGSLSNGNFNPEKSDVDILAELDEENPVKKGENIMMLWADLEKLFSRKVDLLTSSKMHNPYLQKQIDTTKQLIYDRTSS